VERMTVAALRFAGASVLASAIHNGNVELAARHAFALLFPLAVIAYPEAVTMNNAAANDRRTQ